jgi:hypothetical protein
MERIDVSGLKSVVRYGIMERKGRASRIWL